MNKELKTRQIEEAKSRIYKNRNRVQKRPLQYIHTKEKWKEYEGRKVEV